LVFGAVVEFNNDLAKQAVLARLMLVRQRSLKLLDG